MFESFVSLHRRNLIEMDVNKVDRKVLKSTLKEIIKDDFKTYRELIKEVIREILTENQSISTESDEVRTKRLEAFIEQDFNNYDEVFKALA